MTHLSHLVRLSVLALAVAVLAAGTCGPPPPSFQSPSSSTDDTNDGSDGSNGTDTSADSGDTTSDDTSVTADDTNTNRVRIVVQDFGNIDITLLPDDAPLTVAAFLGMVDEGYFDHTIVHRVVADFVIQAGAFDADFNDLPDRDNVPNESDNGLSNLQGTVSTALLSGQPDSFTNSFFINTVDNAFLDDAGHTVFGRVDAGFDVVQAIEQVPVDGDTPTVPPLIVSISRIE